jgi:hypothetical protein
MWASAITALEAAPPIPSRFSMEPKEGPSSI